MKAAQRNQNQATCNQESCPDTANQHWQIFREFMIAFPEFTLINVRYIHIQSSPNKANTSIAVAVEIPTQSNRKKETIVMMYMK